MASRKPESKTKAHVSLMFHTGAQIPGSHPLLEGGGDTARYMRFNGLGDVASKRAALEAVIRARRAPKVA